MKVTEEDFKTFVKVCQKINEIRNDKNVIEGLGNIDPNLKYLDTISCIDIEDIRDYDTHLQFEQEICENYDEYYVKYVSLPIKYLFEDNYLDTIRKDIKIKKEKELKEKERKFQEELKKKKEKLEKAKIAAEKRDRAEYERLKKKYNG